MLSSTFLSFRPCCLFIQPKETSETAKFMKTSHVHAVGKVAQTYLEHSMTQLLKYTVAYSTRPSFRPKTNNQPPKKFLSLATQGDKVYIFPTSI